MNDPSIQPSSAAEPSGPRAETAANADDGAAFAIAAARVALESHCTDVTVLDLRGLSGIADFFVIGTGTSERQMHAVIDEIEALGKRCGRRATRVADSRSAAWILADYADVMIHLFDARHRAYYDIDGLWGDAPRLKTTEPRP